MRDDFYRAIVKMAPTPSLNGSDSLYKMFREVTAAREEKAKKEST